MSKSIFLPLIIVLMGLLGCTKEPALKVYSLDMPQVDQVKRSHYNTKNIKVTYPYSVKEEVSQKMHFAYSNNDRGSYQNAEWSNNMSKLLQGTFIEVLDASKLFKAVLLDTSSANEDYRLESTIFAFHHSVSGAESYAIISIQFTLIDTHSGHLVKSRRFSYQEATPSVDAKGYAKAVNRGVARLSLDLVEWMR